MDGALVLILVLVVGGIVVQRSIRRLRTELDRAGRERRHLAARVSGLEARLAASPQHAETRDAAVAEPAPASPRSRRAPVPPAEDEYAAAEAELLAQEASTPEADVPEASGEPPVRYTPDAAIAAAHAAPVPVPRRHGAADAPPEEPRERRPAAFSLEDFLGGRVLLVVGVVVVLFALGFFMKYAIERDLVEPRVRVATGVAAGLAALVGGDILRRRGFDVFGHAVMGGGLGAWFLATFFAAARYDLIGRPSAFAVSAAVALAGVVLALRREAPLLAYLGFLGGYAAPVILGEGRDALEGLTGWLLALHCGVLVVVWLRRWPGLDLMALAASLAYYVAWAQRYAAPPRVGAAAWTLTALTAAVLAIALAPGVLRRRPLGPTALLAAIVAGAASVTAGFELFHPEHAHALGGGILALAVVYVLAARRAVGSARGLAVDTPVLDGCAAAAVAAAIPTFLEGAALAPAWSAAGVVAVLLAATYRSPIVAAGGLLMIALAQADLLQNRTPFHDQPFVPFANGAFFSWAAPSVAVVVAGLIVRWRAPWRTLSGLMLGAGAWLYAPVLAAEVMYHFFEDRARYGPGNEELGVTAGIGALGAYALLLGLLVRSRRPVAILLPLGPLAAASLLAVPALFFMDRAGFVPIANVAFVGGAVVVAAWWTCTAAARGPLQVVLLIGSVVAGLALLGAECVAYGENAATVGASSRQDLRRVAQVWMSVTFAIYAASLLVLGFVRRTPALRWSGLAIFLLTLFKVFFFDMAQLPTVHRIGGFLVLGLLLLGASFLYQRVRRDDDEPGAAADAR